MKTKISVVYCGVFWLYTQLLTPTQFSYLSSKQNSAITADQKASLSDEQKKQVCTEIDCSADNTNSGEDNMYCTEPILLAKTSSSNPPLPLNNISFVWHRYVLHIWYITLSHSILHVTYSLQKFCHMSKQKVLVCVCRPKNGCHGDDNSIDATADHCSRRTLGLIERADSIWIFVVTIDNCVWMASSLSQSDIYLTGGFHDSISI